MHVVVLKICIALSSFFKLPHLANITKEHLLAVHHTSLKGWPHMALCLSGS